MYQSRSGRIVCSSPCAEHLSGAEDALEIVREKTLTSTRYSAYFLVGVGILFGAFALFELRRGRWPMVAFLGGVTLISIVAAVALLRMLARKCERPDFSTTPAPNQHHTDHDLVA
jgi:uncharacterized membrane protein